MKPNEHANLLSIFFWVYAVIQTLMLLFIALYTGFIGYSSVIIAMEDRNNAPEMTTLFVIIFIVLVVLLLIGFTSMVLNVIIGFGLRRGRTWTSFWGKVASILSIISFVCGGILLLPFGTALGIYGLWFFFSETGRQYFQDGNVIGNQFPPPPNQW